MSHVFLEMTMTLDGFTAAPGVSLEHPFGIDGERMHDWIRGGQGPTSINGRGPEGAADTSPDEIDLSVAARMFDTTGAFVIGRRTFDVGDGPWGDDATFEGRPVFVVTSRERKPIERGGSRFEFVTGGVAEAVARASAAAHAASVCILGGADVARQSLSAGLVDEVRLHLVPLLLGGGTRLFPNASGPRVELEPLGAEQGALAMHLRYRVERDL
jgi:dihydrofolate reductase